MPGALSKSKKELFEKLLLDASAASGQRRAIVRRPNGTNVPLSYPQQQIWLHSQFAGELPIYNEPLTIHLYGSIHRPALEKAFTEIVRRHEAWRTIFDWQGNDLAQFVQPAPQHIAIPYFDVSSLPAEAREAATLEKATADALLPFDLEVGPLYRPLLLRISADEHRLFLTLHHIIFDGFSIYRIFLPELQTLYGAFCQSLPSPLAPPPLQYGDFSQWQRGWVDEVAPGQLAYWRRKLAGAQKKDIPKTDHTRPAIQTYRGDVVKISMDARTCDGLGAMSQRLNVTPFMSLLATFFILLWAWSREEDLMIGVSSAGRNHEELLGIMGYFLDTVVLRTSLADNPPFDRLALQCKEELFGALANDGVPFSMVVKELAVGRDDSRHPFFQVLFSLLPPLPPLSPGWKFSRMDIHTSSAKFDLNLELDECPDGIEGRCIYNTDLFERSTIERMMGAWYRIVAEVVANPNRRISELVTHMHIPPSVS